MAALNSSETELIDLIQVELPWSVPSASRRNFFYLFFRAPFTANVILSLFFMTDFVWVIPVASPAGILSEFSALCWLFGRYMYDKLKYPIGLVESCWGGTTVEAWSSARALKQCGLQRTQDKSGTPDGDTTSQFVLCVNRYTVASFQPEGE